MYIIKRQHKVFVVVRGGALVEALRYKEGRVSIPDGVIGIFH
jgi:hypothetical protein